MRREQQVWAAPKRVPFRQWLGICDIECSANAPRIERTHQCVCIHNWATRGVDQQSALVKQAELPLADKPARLRRCGEDENHYIGARQQVIQLAYGMHFRIGPRASRHANHRDSKWLKHALDFLADRPVAHKQHRFTRQLFCEHRRIDRVRVAGDRRVVHAGLDTAPPIARPLNVEIQRKIFQHRQDCRYGPLRGGDIVRAVRIADRYVRAHRSGNPLRAGHHCEHELHAIQVRPCAYRPGRIGIGNPDIDFDVVVHFVRHRDQLDPLGEIAEQLNGQCSGVSDSQHAVFCAQRARAPRFHPNAALTMLDAVLRLLFC